MQYSYAWVGSAQNAWMDSEMDVSHLAAIERDIATKTAQIAAGTIPHYGYLDVMHDSSMRVGVCVFRAIPQGTRSEVDAGYFLPEWNDLADSLVGKTLTMSHASYVGIKLANASLKVSNSVAKALMRTPLREFVTIDTRAFTIAKPGAEANPRTIFRVIKLDTPVEIDAL